MGRVPKDSSEDRKNFNSCLPHNEYFTNLENGQTDMKHKTKRIISEEIKRDKSLTTQEMKDTATRPISSNLDVSST